MEQESDHLEGTSRLVRWKQQPIDLSDDRLEKLLCAYDSTIVPVIVSRLLL